jgi:GNAT superfamily N-acetyltransferase
MPQVATAAFERIAVGLPVQALLTEIEAIPELWDLDKWRQDTHGSPHVDTRCILVRMPESLWIPTRVKPENVFEDLTVEDLPAVQQLPTVAKLVSDLVERTGAIRVGRVMITELKAGGWIRPHVDEGGYADHYDRFHIVLQAAPGNRFSVGAEVEEMHAGDAWWFNHKIGHFVQNFSDTPRIHLIVDLVAPKYRALRCDGVSFQPELIRGLWPEADPLFERHKDEIAHYADIRLNIDKASYEKAEEAGILKVYTARSLPAFSLIGYALYFVGPNLHYKDSIQARQDVVYLAPEWRKGRLGMRLIAYADERLRDWGVQCTHHHAKLAHPAIGRVLEHLGYTEVERIYSKRLDQ